jgi:hypothetical protein
MAIVIRIVSADGKNVIMKSLPGLPAKLKVPAGARVEVVEDGKTVSLAQYVNEHANRQNPDDVLHNTKVSIETADSWATAETWLDSLSAASAEPSSSWFSTADEQSSVLGFDTDALLIGGVVAAGVGFGVYELTRNGGGDKDTVAPVAPSALDLAVEDDTGSVNTDNITTKTTGLTVSGTAEAGSTVELFDGTTSLGTVTTNAQGKFTKDLDLAAGDHSITARATDSAGNVSAPATAIKITVDTAAPAVPTGLDLAAEDDTGPSNSDNVTSKGSGLTITGTAEAGSTVELFDGTVSLGTATVGTNGTFSRDVSLAPGTHSITVRATDLAGNVSAPSTALDITVSADATFALDLAAEDDTGVNTDNITSKTSDLTISGTTVANGTIELFDGATSLGTVVAGANGLFTKDVNLTEGTHAITAKVVGGSAVSEVLSVVVDTTAPGKLIAPDLAAADDTGTSTSDDITSKTTGLTFTGTATGAANVELFVDGTSVGQVAVRANGSYTNDLTLTEGVHAITARAIDAAGNVGEISPALQVTVDTATPGAPTGLDLATADDNGTSDSDNITSLTSGLTISGAAIAGSSVELFDGATSLGKVTAGANGTFTTDIALAVGAHSITAKATDVAGNASAASTALGITIVDGVQSAAASVSLLSELAPSQLDHVSLFDSSGSFG